MANSFSHELKESPNFPSFPHQPDRNQKAKSNFSQHHYPATH
jgi:hypothetical protein